MIKERDNIRATNPADPRLDQLNTEIKDSINTHKKEVWLEHLANCPAGSKKLWDTIKTPAPLQIKVSLLMGKKSKTPKR